ncbi:MAG: hypothetical protein ACK5MA_00910 [Parachlamydiaceae bacterium]
MTLQLPIHQAQPFQSLAQFAEGHRFVDQPSKVQFFMRIQALFARHAYKKLTLSIPPELVQDLPKKILPELFSAIDLHNRHLFTHLIANISKVAKCTLSPIDTTRIHHLCVVDKDNPKKTLLWGWIYSSFVNSSSTLKDRIGPDGIIYLEDVSPLVLWTLKHFQEGYLLGLRQTEIPVVCEDALSQFFDKWGMRVPKLAFVNWVSQTKPSPTKDIHPTFNPKNLYRSIKRFTRGFFAFPEDRCHTFLKAFSTLFACKAYEQEDQPLPEKYVLRFIKIDLPFLLTITNPPSDIQQRLLAAIQAVSKKTIRSLQLRLGTKLYLSPQPHIYSEETLHQLFLHNITASPHTPIQKVLEETYGKIPLSREYLKSLWDVVDAKKKAELLNLYVMKAHSALESKLFLAHLSQFCVHLALGTVNYLHKEAGAFYQFLKDAQREGAFIHPELLHTMLTNFSQIYPLTELQDWRKEKKPQLTRFFEEFEALNVNDPLKTHLQRCCTELNTLDEMEEGFAVLFAQEHPFTMQPETVNRVFSFLQTNEHLFTGICPLFLQNAYQFLLKQVREYLDHVAHLQEYRARLELFQPDETLVTLFMNTLWKISRRTSHKAYESLETAWENPIPVPLQVECLYVLNQLDPKMIPLAAEILDKDNAKLSLTLSQLKEKMVARKLCLKAMDLIVQFKSFEPTAEQALLEPQDQPPFIAFLKDAEIMQLTAKHPDLEQYRIRLLNILDPDLLTLSYLWVSQRWKS